MSKSGAVIATWTVSLLAAFAGGFVLAGGDGDPPTSDVPNAHIVPPVAHRIQDEEGRPPAEFRNRSVAEWASMIAGTGIERGARGICQDVLKLSPEQVEVLLPALVLRAAAGKFTCGIDWAKLTTDARVTTLHAGLGSTLPQANQWALRELLGLPDELLTRWPSILRTEVSRLLRAKDERTQAHACQLIHRLGAGQDDVKQLLNIVKHNSLPTAQICALKSLQVTSTTLEAQEAQEVVDALSSPLVYLVVEAIRTLDVLEVTSLDWHPKVESLKGHPHPAVRQAAEQALRDK